MDDARFTLADQLAWCRFMFHSVVALCLDHSRKAGSGSDELSAILRRRMAPLWQGLGAQGVEGAMLSTRLTLEAIGCTIKSSQVSPEMAEVIVDDIPGQEVLNGLLERFDIELDRNDWAAGLSLETSELDRTFDLVGAIADAAGVEYVRDITEDGDVRLLLRAW